MTEQEIRDLVLQVLHDEGADMQDNSQVPDATDNELESSAVTMPLLVGSGVDAAYKKALLSRIVNKINEYVLGNIDAQAIRQALPELDAEMNKIGYDANAYASVEQLRDYLNRTGGGQTKGLRYIEVDGVRYVLYLFSDNETVGYRSYLQGGTYSFLILEEDGTISTQSVSEGAGDAIDQAIITALEGLHFEMADDSDYGWGSGGTGNYTITANDGGTITINTANYPSKVLDIVNGGIVGAADLAAVLMGTETIITDIRQL